MFPIPGLKAFLMNTNLCIQLSYINIVATTFVVDEGRMKSTWRRWLFPNIIFLSSRCGASPPGWATWEITEFPTHQQYKIDVYISLYSSGIRKAFNLGMGNKPYCGYCWCVGNSVISRVAQPGGEAPHLEDNAWECSTPSSWFHTTLIHHKRCCNNVDIR